MVTLGLEKNSKLPTLLASSHLLPGIFTIERAGFGGIVGIKER